MNKLVSSVFRLHRYPWLHTWLHPRSLVRTVNALGTKSALLYSLLHSSYWFGPGAQSGDGSCLRANWHLSWYSFPSLEDSFQSSNPEYSSRLALKVVRKWKNLLSQLPVNPTHMNSIPELGRPRVLYAVSLVLGGQSIKFRFRKPRILLALFEMVLIWSFHRRSTDR